MDSTLKAGSTIDSTIKVQHEGWASVFDAIQIDLSGTIGTSGLVSASGLDAVSVQPGHALNSNLAMSGQKASPKQIKSTSGSVLSVSQGGKVVTVNVNQIQGIDVTGSTDVTTLINNENLAALRLHPGASLVDNFGSPTDKYDIQGEVTLYSNMTVDGNGATIVSYPKADWQTSAGQFVNQDATPNAGPNAIGTAAPPGINTNISVKGLVFYYPNPSWNVPIWIQNANGVDVQDNVFMAASNGQEFLVNAQNAIVSNNVSVGNINGALNGWGGLSNVAVANNYVSNSGSAAGSAGAWFNGVSSPYGVLGGGEQNVYSVGNTVEGIRPGGTAIGVGPLTSSVNESGINIFGSMDALNGIPSTFGYLASSTQNSAIAYNIVVGYVAGNPEETTLFDMSSNTTSGYPISSNDAMIGNLAYGSTRSFQDFQAVGSNITLLDNALINGQSARPSEYQPLVGTSDGTQGQVIGQSGQLAGGTMVGGPVDSGINLGGPVQAFDPSMGTVPLDGLTLSDAAGAAAGTITVTASDIFGTLTDGALSGKTVSVSGDLSQVTQFLDSLSFTSGPQGWDDLIHLQATQGTQTGSVWDIPVNVGTIGITGSGAADYSIAANSNSYNPSTGVPLSGGESLTTLGGGTLVTGFDPVTATLSGTLYAAVVGEGGATITGTTVGQSGDISGIGYIDALLTRGGNDTITPGMAGATVDAATGNDLIQSNEGFVNATLGSGSDTVVLGLAGGDITGGSGHDTIVNLPDHGGPVNLTLGSGGGDVYLLSGDNNILTMQGANSSFQFGIGTTSLTSHGNDTVRAGAGILDLTVSTGANDLLMEGPGVTNLVGAGGNLLVDPFYTEQTVSNGSTLAVAATPSPAQTFVASLDNVTGSFGELGGAIFKSSSMTAQTIVGSSALVHTDLVVSGTSTQGGTLSLDGTSTLTALSSSEENIASIALGAVIEGVGSIAGYDNGTLMAGSASFDVALPQGERFAFSGGTNGTVTATVVRTLAASSAPAGSSPVTYQADTGVSTTLAVDPEAATTIQSALNGAIGATTHIETIDLTGTLDLTAAPVSSGTASSDFLHVQADSATGTISLAQSSQATPSSFAGELVTGTGSITLDGGSGSGDLLILAAGTDVTWNGSDSTQNTVSVYGGGTSNTLNVGGAVTDIFEGGGTNSINLQSSAAVKDPIADITTASDASEIIQIAAGYATISSAGHDTISLTGRVQDNTISMTGSVSSLNLGAHASNNVATLGGKGETALIAGSKNIIYVDGADTVTLTGSNNTVYDNNVNAIIVNNGHNKVIDAAPTTASAVGILTSPSSMTFISPQQGKTTSGGTLSKTASTSVTSGARTLTVMAAFGSLLQPDPASTQTTSLAADMPSASTSSSAALISLLTGHVTTPEGGAAGVHAIGMGLLEHFLF